MMKSLYGSYRQLTLSDVWHSSGEFTAEYEASGLYSDANQRMTKAIQLFYLLYAKYGNSVIASSDLNQFKYKVFSIMYQYGPSWEKELEMQYKLRNLTDAELTSTAKTIHNHAYNPSTQSVTGELDYINEQNTQQTNRSKLESYGILLALLKNDVTEQFLDRFKSLFLVIVQPEAPLWYVSDISEEEEDDGSDN